MVDEKTSKETDEKGEEHEPKTPEDIVKVQQQHKIQSDLSTQPLHRPQQPPQTQQQTFNADYSSSPSSTTSSLNRGKYFLHQISPTKNSVKTLKMNIHSV